MCNRIASLSQCGDVGSFEDTGVVLLSQRPRELTVKWMDVYIFSWPNNVPFCARILHFLYLFIYQLASRLIPCSACCEYCCSTSLHGVVISCGYLPQMGRPDRSWAGSMLLLWICHNSQRHVHSQTQRAEFSSCPCYHLLILVLSLGTC